jgi:cbb3-type cytochrome oxidase maturation protein
MNVLVLLIPIAIVFTLLAIYLFTWAVSNGQYDDLERDASRILYEDEANAPEDNDA